MLQWMGGSRRKVTTSRKSTQKRQKQYFEQRKRQQQHDEAAYRENHTDGLLTCDRQKGNRSLDVLSLLNVSKVAEDCRTQFENVTCPVTESVSTMANKCTQARSFEDVDSVSGHVLSVNRDNSWSLPTTMDHGASPLNSIEPTGTRTPSVPQMATLSLERTNTSKVRNTESDYLKDASSTMFSILDLIGDDGASGSSERYTRQEAHAAFSIEGLGQLGTKTPVQSPQRPERISSSGQSPFAEAARKLHSYKNFNKMLTDLEMEEEVNPPMQECLMQDVEKPSPGSYVDSFSISGYPLFPFRGTNHKLSAAKDSIQLDSNQWEIYDEDRLVNSWNANSPSLDDNTVNVKCGTNWRNDNATTNSCFQKNDGPNFKFEGCHLPPRCKEKMIDRCDILDGGGHNFLSSDEPEYSSFMCNHHSQADCSSSPYMTLEDTRDSLTWLRGESCSSSEVGCVDNANLASARCKKGYAKSLQRPFMSNVKEDDKGIWCTMPGKMRRGEEYDRSHKYRRSNSPRRRPAYFSQATSNNMKMHDEEWLLDEGFPLPNTNSVPDSFFKLSEPSRHYRGDLFSTDPEADLLYNSTSSFGRSRKDPPDEFKSENAAFGQPFCSRQSINTSFFATVNCEESCLGLNHNIKIHSQSSHSSPVADILEEAESATANPDLSEHGLTEEAGDKTKCQPPDPEQGVQFSSDDNNVTPESTHFKDGDAIFGYHKNKSLQETMVSSPEDVEATSFSAKIPHGLNGDLINQELQGNVPGPSEQNLKGANTNVGYDDPKEPEAKTTLIESSYQLMMFHQLMMFQRCVQFLCILKS